MKKTTTQVPDENHPKRTFPEVAWMGLFGKFRVLLGHSTESPDVFLWASLAACLSVLVGRDVSMPWGASSLVPVINVAIIGLTGRGRKSTPITDAIKVVFQPLRPRPTEEGEPESVDESNGLGSGEGFADAIADKEWWPPSDRRRKNPPNVLTGRRALFVVHEFGALLEKVKRGEAGAMIDFVLALFDAREQMTHRTRSRSIMMTNAVGVMLVASTKAWLVENLTQAHVHAGLVNRFLWFTGARKEPLSQRPVIPADQQVAFQNAVRTCLAKAKGREFTLDPEATAHHDERYRQDYAAKTTSDIDDAATARASEYALRIALLLAVADESDAICLRHIEAAWAVADYSNENALEIVAGLHEQTLRDATKRVLDAARRASAKNPNFSRRDVYQLVKGSNGMPAETFNRIWQALILEGDIVAVALEKFRLAGERGTGGAGE